MTYAVGDRATLTVTFRNFAGTLTNPTTVVLRVRRDRDEEKEYEFGEDSEITRNSVGMYTAEFVIDEPGRYAYRWEGSGTLDSVFEDVFFVDASRL